MAELRRFLARVFTSLMPDRAERALAREVEAHLSILQREYESRGLSAEDARLAARKAFGGVERAKEHHRDTRSFPSLENLMRDLRLTFRTLSRSPAFSLVTVLLVALGVGATTTLFSLAYGVLFRPLPWPDAGTIMRLQETRGGNQGRVPGTITNTTYHAWRDQPGTIEEIGGWTRRRSVRVVVDGAAPEPLRVLSVTPGLFRVLRASPAAGRLLADTDLDARGTGNAIVIEFGVWQRRFGGRPDVIGKTIRLDDRAMTIVGVMPRDFFFPDREAEAWVPLGVARVIPGANTIPGMIFNAIARLRPGATPEQATSEATARGRAAPSLLEAGLALFGSSGEIRVVAVPARDALTGEVRPALLMLLAAVGLLFCTAIASLVILQSSRAVKRHREMAVRAAIGAGTGRLTVLWLLESGVLATLGGIAGLVLSYAFHRALPTILPSDFPRVDDITLDVRVALFAAALALLASLVCGIVPAWQSRNRSLTASLASDSLAWHAGTPFHGLRLRAAMMVAQVGVACVLLVGTGLLARSWTALLAVDRGFDPRDVLTAHATIDPRPFAAQAASLERAQDRIRALPGVTHVAFGNSLPFVTFGALQGMILPSLKDPGTKVQAQALMRVVSPEYFGAMGLRLLAGRALERTDSSTSRPIVVVNRTFATQYLRPSPVGTVLPMPYGTRKEWEIVGIVDDVRQGGLRGIAPSLFGGVTDPPQPELYFTYRQWDFPVTELVYVVRGTADPASLTATVRTILREEEPRLAIESTMTMDERVTASLARPRAYAMLVGGFAVFAVAIALVGLFGVLSHMAAQRTRELGLRSALGARPVDMLGVVARDAAWISVCGVVAGLGLAYILSRWLATFLYGVTSHDPFTFVAVPLFLLVAAATACAIPAYRATRISPLVALRTG